jgi:hypothetical protein
MSASEKSRELLEAKVTQPAVEMTEPLTDAQRLRVARDIVERLRSAGVTCGILNGIQPIQKL